MEGIIFAILAVFAVLVLVSLLLPWADRRSVPSTLVLAMLGMALGLLLLATGPEWRAGPISDVITGLRAFGVNAEAFLYLFLPALLFTAGLNIDVRLMLDEAGAVLLLAVIAVVVCTVVVGFALASASAFGLIACLLIGSIVATTDPAAVIGLFHDLGAPRRLTTLIAGESVLNDAAAIALFAVLLGMVTGTQALDVGQGLLTLLRNFLGGIVLGYLAARLTCAALQRLRNTRVAEITISIALAYLVFVVGDHYLHVSGVVAVVVAAMTFAVYGRTRLTPGTWEPLVETWNQLEFWASSLIFVLAAMFAAQALAEATWTDAWLVLVLVIGALVARAIVLWGLLPLLVVSRAAAPIGPRFKAVIVWGGLRGAITLTLALSVSQLEAVPDDIRRFVLVMATGYVLFTLLVQGTTLKPLLRLLGLDQLNRTELAVRDRAMALSSYALRDQIEVVAKNYGFDTALVGDILSESDGAGGTADDKTMASLSEDERRAVGLLTIANRERELYLRHFRDGTLSRQMVGRLVADADRLIDRVKVDGAKGYRAATDRAIRMPWDLRAALWLHRHLGWTRPLARRLAHRFERLIVLDLIVREIERFNSRAIADLLGKDVSTALAKVVDDRHDSIRTALAAVEVQYPAFTRDMRRIYLARAALRIEEAQYRRQLSDALIGREIFSDLEKSLARRWTKLDKGAELDLGLGLTEMLGRAPLFSRLNEAQLSQLARCLKPRLAMPDETIIRKGQTGGAMYFIVSGKVQVRLSKGPVELGPGDFFGELALITRQPRTADVASTGYCQLLALESRDFRLLLRSVPEIRERIEEAARERLGAGSDIALDATN